MINGCVVFGYASTNQFSRSRSRDSCVKDMLCLACQTMKMGELESRLMTKDGAEI